jgi:hypothetical protein
MYNFANMESLFQSGFLNGAASVIALHTAISSRDEIPDYLINTAWFVCGANAAISALYYCAYTDKRENRRRREKTA